MIKIKVRLSNMSFNRLDWLNLILSVFNTLKNLLIKKGGK